MELLIALGVAGIFLGIYCHFLLLVPITLVTVIVCGAMSMSHGQSIVEMLLCMLVSAVALQGGYMVGLTSREFLMPSKRI